MPSNDIGEWHAGYRQRNMSIEYLEQRNYTIILTFDIGTCELVMFLIGPVDEVPPMSNIWPVIEANTGAARKYLVLLFSFIVFL